MTRAVPAVLLMSAALALPAAAQPMDHMPGMAMPAARPAHAETHPAHPPGHRRRAARHHRGAPAPRAAHPAQSSAAAPAASGAAPSYAAGAMPGMAMPGPEAPHAMADMPGMAPQPPQSHQPAQGMAGMDMSGMDMSGTDKSSVGPAQAERPQVEIPHTAPPPPPADHAADRYFDPAAMAAARATVRREHGGEAWSMAMANLAEYQARRGRGGYRWEAEASFGGDLNRIWLKSEGEGTGREGVEAAEIQALYSRAVGPYFNLQAGVRQDLQPGPKRTYATVGFEGLAPYWLEVSGAVFLSHRGEVFARLEGYQDLRVTQRLILQPRAEINLSAQNVPQIGIGSGVSNLELGLRLRYEVTRQVAPYVGVSYDRKFGATADYARAIGNRAGVPSVVVGVRTWF